MAKKPEPPKPTTWTIYKIAATQERPGTVEAPGEATAMEKAAAEFGVSGKRLMAISGDQPSDFTRGSLSEICPPRRQSVHGP
jgi:hypothetical protein